MSRKLLVMLVLGAAAGCIVAMVRAQESSFHPYPVQTVAANENSSSVQSRSVLRRSGSSSRRGGLADRLRSIQSKPPATSLSPSTSKPATPSSVLPRTYPSNSQSPSTTGVTAIPVTPQPIGTRVSNLPDTRTDSPAPWKSADANSSRRPPRISGNVVRQEASDVVLTNNLPIVRIETRGPRAITIRKQAPYQVIVSNRGTDDAKGIVVTVDIPRSVQIGGSSVTAGVAGQAAGQGVGQRISWSLDKVSAGQQAILNMLLSPQENQPFQLLTNWAIAPAATTAEIEVQEPRLQMTLSGPKDVLYGETKSYVITLTNPGTGDAESVAVNLSPEFGRQRVEVGTVGAGEQKQVTLSFKANQAGTAVLYAEAVADGGLRTEAKENVLVRRAVLQVASAGPPFKYARSVGTYQVRVVNTGDAPAERVVATVDLPSGAKYAGGIDNQRSLDSKIQWPVGNLAPGAERLFTFHCELNQAGKLQFLTGVEGQGDLSASTTCMTTVEALADLKLSVHDPRGPHPVGKDVAYEIRINNRGTKAATNVNVTAQFSEGIEPVSAGGAQVEIVPGQAIFKPITRIEPGAEIALKVIARAGKSGNLVYRFELNCRDPETRRVSEGTTRFFGDSQGGLTADGLGEPGRLGLQPMPARSIEQR